MDPDIRSAAIERGKRMWLAHRGARHASLEACDLGLGAGRVVGTQAHLPRYFGDADRVMDLEARILWCANNLQGVTPDQLRKQRLADGVMASELSELMAYAASLSATWRLSPAADHAKEKLAVAVGQALYTRRQGPLDFSCAACHGRNAPADAAPQPIMSWQGLPVPRLTAASGAGGRGWPVWQAASGELQTAHDKLAVCFWRMGVAPPAAGSDPLVALVAYLTHQGMASERRADGDGR